MLSEALMSFVYLFGVNVYSLLGRDGLFLIRLNHLILNDFLVPISLRLCVILDDRRLLVLLHILIDLCKWCWLGAIELNGWFWAHHDI